MADIAIARQPTVIFPCNSEIYTGVAAEAITAGQVVYLTSAGTWGLADANASGKHNAAGIALQDAGVGQAVDFLKRGFVAGYTLSQAYAAQLFLSDTAGAMADAAGTTSVAVGRVMCLSDGPNYTKAVYVNFQWTIQY